MKKAAFSSLIILLLVSFVSRESNEQLFRNSDFSCKYHLEQGKLHGKYTSFYKNGALKVSGEFEYNSRVGKWTLHDSTGRMRTKRIYSDPFTFKRTFPKPKKDKLIKLLNVPDYNVKYNSEGYIPYPYTHEGDVLSARRHWRMIKAKYNSELFEKNILFTTLNDQIKLNNIKAYNPKDDEFREKMNSAEIDTTGIEIIGFKCKEHVIIDSKRQVSQRFTIGLCPVMQNAITKDTLDLYWVYYPEVREYLAQNKIETPDEKVQTIDDVFFYSSYHSQIYKEANVYDRSFSDYLNSKLEFQEESERIELETIEEEHDYWLSLTK